MKLSRRNFLKLSGLSFAGTFLPPTPPDEAPRSVEGLGRVIRASNVYERPSVKSQKVTLLLSETIIKIYATVTGEDENYNRTWYQVQQGYVYSGLIQPVRWQLQSPVTKVPREGFLGEITVPYALAKNGPSATAPSVYRLYYGTTHWIKAVEEDYKGRFWYRIFDDRLLHYSWIKSEHVRRITAEEIAPISPTVENKRIEIDLEKQTFRCFEDEKLVLETLCSTGPYLRLENGRKIYGTPSGEWMINRKRSSRHMAGDDFASDDFFDLPGVPWVSYFHWWGVSIHGTYWHNDYGEPHSHGCINLPIETSKWVFRWSQPKSPVTDLETNGHGTKVVVF
jgi:hypothetical protein